MPGSIDRPPDLVADIRKIGSRLAQLENGNARHSNAAPWVTATLLNSYSNFGSGFAPVAYYQDLLGRVFVRGSVQVPASAAVTVFTFDTGYRPAFIHEFSVAGVFADGIANTVIQINTSGNLSVAYTDVGLTGRISLDSVSFRVV